MADQPQDPPAPPAPQGSDADDIDPISQVTPLRRVEAVATQMKPMHRELAEPAPKPHTGRQGMGLVLKPWSRASTPSQLHTMSDLFDMAKAPKASEIAKVRSRHISADQAAAARAKRDDAAKES